MFLSPDRCFPNLQDNPKKDLSEEPFYCICMGMHFEIKGPCEITSARRGGGSSGHSVWGGSSRSSGRGDRDGVWGSGSLHHHHQYRHQLPREQQAQRVDRTYSSEDEPGTPRVTQSRRQRPDNGTQHRAAFEHEGSLVLRVAALSPGTKVLLCPGAELWHPLCLGTPHPVSDALLPVQPQRVISS